MRKTALAFALVIASLVMLPACKRTRPAPKGDPLREAYGLEQDWNNADHWIPLNYQQAQGKRIFYEKCVWCHADSTPAGPSNRSNLTPNPPLINDGATLNPLSDAYLENVITLGGAAMGKSAIMPPWGRTLRQEDIRALVAYIRAVAQPPYQRPAQPGPRYSAR
jgi:mono/diheme cytochrome c family protein